VRKGEDIRVPQILVSLPPVVVRLLHFLVSSFIHIPCRRPNTLAGKLSKGLGRGYVLGAEATQAYITRTAAI